MFESIFSLRFILLVAGAVFVLAIYFRGRGKNKHNARIKYAPRRTRFEPRHAAATAASEPDRSGLDSAPQDGAAASGQDKVVLAGDDPVAELPSITREGADEIAPPRPKRKDFQLEMPFDDNSMAHPVVAANVGSGPGETLIALYVRPPAGHEFSGPAIVRAMNSVGLRFGDMDIFHHFGAGDLRADSPLFSVANIVEPGNFDLPNIDGFATPGLALFLSLPGPLDGAVTFELFLNTGQRLAEALSGDLYGDPQKLLDGATIDNMRKVALPFANGD